MTFDSPSYPDSAGAAADRPPLASAPLPQPVRAAASRHVATRRISPSSVAPHADRRVIWTEATGAATGHAYSIAYPSIAMHAVSSGLDPEQPAAQQRPCIYMQLDPGGPNQLGGGDADEDAAAVPELHLVPADPSTRERGQLASALHARHPHQLRLFLVRLQYVCCWCVSAVGAVQVEDICLDELVARALLCIR